MRMSLALAVCIVVALAMEYRSVWQAGFVYEDGRSLAAADQPLSTPIWRPRLVTAWSWRAQRGQSAAAHHAVNLVLHVASVALTALLFWRLTGDALVVITGAVVVALHPLQVESVAYLTGRAEIIGSLGVLLAALAATWRTAAAALGLAAGVLLAIGGKESAAVALPLAVLVGWQQRRVHGSWVLVAVAGLLVLGWSTTGTFYGRPSMAWALTQGAAAARLAGLSVWPTGLTVDFDYDRWTVLMQAGATAGLVGALVLVAWCGRAAMFGAAWIAIVIAPRLIVPTPDSLFNEHQWRIATIGVAWLLAIALGRLPATITWSAATC